MCEPDGPPEQALLVRIADSVRSLLANQARVIVAFDGPDAAGKTTMADALALLLGDGAVRASIDGFHNPREVRLRRGPLSPVGYYQDSFDYERLRDDLLGPFAKGAHRVLTREFGYRTEAAQEAFVDGIPDSAVLVFDGVFLLRRETRSFWDLCVYLDVPPAVTLNRALVRDLPLFGSAADVTRRYQARYLPGQALYREESDPKARATVVVDNSEPSRPVILRWGNEGFASPPPGIGDAG
jgi:uridine kinase